MMCKCVDVQHMKRNCSEVFHLNFSKRSFAVANIFVFQIFQTWLYLLKIGVQDCLLQNSYLVQRVEAPPLVFPPFSGHSSGAEATMRLLETQKLRGAAARHSNESWLRKGKKPKKFSHLDMSFCMGNKLRIEISI